MNSLTAACTRMAARIAWPMLAGWMLLACTTQPPTPAWQINSHAALGAAENAWLAGRTPEARHEWSKAREQVSLTGDPARLARLELRQCAMQVASLDWQDCTGFEALRPVTGESERAYADYLYRWPTESQIPLLPKAQQRVARAKVAAATSPQAWGQSVAAVTEVQEPLSRLLAAAVVWRAHADDSELHPAPAPAMRRLLQTAIDTASAQGWRRPLLAWLLVQAQYARRIGDDALLAESQMRLRLIESRGALAAVPSHATTVEPSSIPPDTGVEPLRTP